MKKLLAIIPILLMFGIIVGCGKSKQEDIVDSLGEKVNDLTKFSTTAVMEINDQNKKHIFDIEVKYFKTKDDLELFKVTMKNQDSNNVQVILKNEEGVFVLNPTLNKSFKFQSDWPYNSSQPYLFQSLVKDILNDKNTIFVKQGDDYVFETKANYMKSKDLVKQKIVINGKTLFPKSVSVYDQQNQEQIRVLFGDFNLKPDFKESEFYVEATMSTIKEVYGNVIPVVSVEKPVFSPTLALEGATVEKNVYDNRIIMSYLGDDYSFVFVQEAAALTDELVYELISGEPMIIGDGIGFVTNNTITWYRDGVKLQIIALDIDKTMLLVANSVVEEGK